MLIYYPLQCCLSHIRKSFNGINRKAQYFLIRQFCSFSKFKHYRSTFRKNNLYLPTYIFDLKEISISHCRYAVPYIDYQKLKNKTVRLYITAIVFLMGGLSYAAVPLYRIYCQATGKGGQAFQTEIGDEIAEMKKVPDRIINVRFYADTISSLQWNFKPQQTEIKVMPGETALAFYTAKNPTNIPIDGIATYNVLPYEAGQYFNKIQCFCFEEQRLNPNEEVDMPVFFYLDPEFAEDPKMENIDEIVLSYTFFEAKKGLKLPIPNF